jgi:hypothetical protein
MKTIFFSLCLLTSFFANAQEKPAPPDSTFSGQIITDKTHHTKIYLTNFQQTVDDNGVYTTTFTFGFRFSRPTFDVNITMNFDNPLIQDGPIGFQYGPAGVGRFNGGGALRNNNKFLFLQGQWTSSSHHFFIKVKSKEKIHPVIKGLDGQLNF